MAEAVGIAAAAAQFAELLFKAAKLARDIQAASDSAHMTRRIFQLETFAAIASNFAESSLGDDPIIADILQRYTPTVASLIEKLSQLRINSADGRRERTKKAVRSLLEKDDIEALFEQLQRDQIALLLHRSLTPNENPVSNVTEALNQVLDARLEYANPNSDAEQKFLDGIFVSDPRDDRNALIGRKGRHVRGTCAWVTQTPEFRSWHSTDAPSPGLILEGGPGQGKSMMAIFLTRQLEEFAKDCDNESVIYFFCDNGNARQNNALSIFRCLIWQLCRLRPELLLHGIKELRDRGNNVQHLLEPPSIGVETLWRIFQSMIMDEKAGTISCVIDGLDECDEESIFLVLDKLHELAARADSDSTKHGFRFIILSRPHVAGQKLPQFGVTLPKVRLDHDWKKNVHSDIKTFIDKQVNDLASASPDNHWPPPLREQVAKVLHEKAGGTFLWVGFVTQDLRRKTSMEVKECLKTLPVGLNGVYDRILSRVPPQHRQAVRSILQWVCFAEHPLRPTELAGLFDEQASKSPSQSAMDSDSDSDSDASHNTALNEASARGTVSRLRDLLRFCNHFVLLVKKFDLDNGDVETVHLVHQSAKDYLTRKENDGESGANYFRLGKRRAIHMDLGRRCINILTQMIDSNQQVGIPPTTSIRSPNNKTAEQPKPYSYTSEDYAALCWARHLRHGGDDYDSDTHALILRIISQDKASHSVWAWQASPNPLLGMHSFYFHKETQDENAATLTKAIALGLSSTVKVLVSGMTVEDYTSTVRSSSGGLLNLALDLRHMRIFEILIEAIGSPALILEPNVISGLADQKSLEVLQRLLKMVKNPRVTFGAELEYCLHKAVYHDSESTFTLLLETGADPVLADIAYPLAPALIDGRSLTPQQQKRPVLFERLTSLGLIHVNKGYRDPKNTGVTLLHQAAASLDTHMVRALIDAGSRPDAVNSSGQLPLHSAVLTPRLYLGTLGLNAEFVDLLVNATRTDAHIGDHPGLVDSKATSHSLVNFRDNDGFAALHHAADVVCESWFDAMLGRGADVDVLDNFGRTPLLVLLDKRHGKPMQPTERGFSGWDMLNYIAYKMVPCTKILRKAGADGNKQDSRGRSPFHCLAEMMASLPKSPQIHLSFGGGFQLRDSLLEFGIDLDLRDKHGRIARDIYPVDWFWEETWTHQQ